MLAAPTDASACGGTFCDAGPASMPVDQSGENILFAMEDGVVEAHVQIQYQGDPEAFAWVVPVMAEPEIEAGSDPLFQALLSATVPTFVLDSRFEDCGPDGPQFGCAFAPESDDLASGATAGEGFGEGDDGPSVVQSGVVGAFEFAVLDGGTVDGVVDWLDENGYAQDDDAPDELRGYLEKGFLFVAFKLRGGAGVDEIHPVVIRYEGDEPCVPIRLTRIAATDDMGVRAFFLGGARVAPTNYRLVEINQAAIDWPGLGSNYESVVTQAVDADGSEGHGFVTEYAGTSDVVFTDGLLNPAWDAARYREADPEAALRELRIQGLLSCNGETCMPAHPLLQGVLERYLPRPTGITFEEYYGCFGCSGTPDIESWDAGAFADDLEARIIGPAEHAVDLLDRFDYLTRLYTTLSPHEMDLDPIFHANADLPDVSNIFSATRTFTCEGPDFVELDDGTRIAVGGFDADPPDFPTALRVFEVPLSGPPMLIADATEAADEARTAWNASQGLDDDSGCNCHARKHGASGFAFSVLMLGTGLWARRRRPATRQSR